MTAAAWVQGAGLACALGPDLDASIDALQQRRMPATRIDVEGLDEALAVNYYRIDDGAALLDPGRLERLLPAVIDAALTKAGLDAGQRRRMPIFSGSSCFSVLASEAAYATALANGADDALPMPAVSYAIFADLARRVTGSTAVDISFNTACTSSANALLAAQRLLVQGRAEHALVLGVELANRTTLAGFAGLQLLTDVVRPFDADRRGLVLGEAVAAIVLGPQQRAQGPLHLRGGAGNCDTHSLTAANPDGRALARVQRHALAASAAESTAMRVIKAHATGTPANDVAEAHSLRAVYPTLPPVTALKPWIGHTLGACGAAELALLVGSLERGFVPATTGFQTLDPALDLRPVTAPLPVLRGLYQLNHFGFGGSNTVLIAEAC